VDKLKDIKSIEYIPIDFTNYFIFTTLFVFLLITLVIFFKTRKKKLTKEQKASNYLKSMDFKSFDDKTLAYNFTLYGHECVQAHYEDEFLKIVRQLEQYKYKKDVKRIDKDLIVQMKDYIKVRL